MLNVLLESRAPRTRRAGGTLASTLVHAAIVSGAIALTVPGPMVAGPATIDPVIPVHPFVPATAGSRDRPRPARPDVVAPNGPTLPPLDDIWTDIPPIDPGEIVTTPTRDDLGPGVGAAAPSGQSGELGGPIGSGDGPLNQRYVDRTPRLLPGSPEPHFPDALRARNQTGRVVVQFVVDTLGRAEQNDLKIIEASDPAFADAVRSVLPRYRFTPGEAGGRKVRTVVQLPFDFALR
jgi:protein TonB